MECNNNERRRNLVLHFFPVFDLCGTRGKTLFGSERISTSAWIFARLLAVPTFAICQYCSHRCLIVNRSASHLFTIYKLSIFPDFAVNADGSVTARKSQSVLICFISASASATSRARVQPWYCRPRRRKNPTDGPTPKAATSGNICSRSWIFCDRRRRSKW